MTPFDGCIIGKTNMRALMICFCACNHQLCLNISINRNKVNLLFVLVFPSGQTIRWRCTSSTEMERRSQWRARLEIRCLMSSSTRTSTLMALVCKHTHAHTLWHWGSQEWCNRNPVPFSPLFFCEHPLSHLMWHQTESKRILSSIWLDWNSSFRQLLKAYVRFFFVFF